MEGVVFPAGDCSPLLFPLAEEPSPCSSPYRIMEQLFPGRYSRLEYRPGDRELVLDPLIGKGHGMGGFPAVV